MIAQWQQQTRILWRSKVSQHMIISCRNTFIWLLVKFFLYAGLAPAIKEILESQPGSSTETGKLIKAKKRQRNRKLKESSNEVSSSKKSSVCKKIWLACFIITYSSDVHFWIASLTVINFLLKFNFKFHQSLTPNKL